MPTLQRRLAATSGAVLLGGVVLATFGLGLSPANAAPPDIEHYTVQSTYTLDATNDIGCAGPDFTVAVNGVDKIVAQTFFDNVGNVTRAVVHDDFTGTETGPNGVPLNSSEHATITDYPDGTESWVGQPLEVSLPHGGKVILDAGKIVYNPDGSIAVEHGPHPFADGDVAAYCAALGG
jgi:hypothetical protein